MLQVKQIHITKARFGDGMCPVALATKELHPNTPISVTHAGIFVGGKLRYQITDRMQSFMITFDNWGASFVKPTAFRLLKVRN